MPSGRRSRALRNAAPPPVHSTDRRADPRVLVVAAGVLVVTVAVVVLVVTLGRGSKPAAARGPLPTAGEAAALYRGIPQHGLVLGSPKAPVQMVEYIDPQCPVCRAFETEVGPDLVSRYVRTGKVRIELRPWAFIGPDSARGQAALFAAADQNRAFQFMQVLYGNQGAENTGWLTDEMIRQIAGSVAGLDVVRLMSDRSKHGADAVAVAKAVAANGVSGTPTVFVDGKLVGAGEVAQAVDAALAP